MGLFSKKIELTTAEAALPGRDEQMPVPAEHFVHGRTLTPPFPDGMEVAMFGMGCFWGAERRFWETDGVYTTAVGYAGGFTPNPTYEEVCSGHTGHTEVVLVVFDPSVISFQRLCSSFWEGHNPTQGMRQGNDIGTQYRSCIYTYTDEQLAEAMQSQAVFQKNLQQAGYPDITTEIQSAGPFYYAEHYHQQYLAKVPNGYCGLGGTGVCYTPSESSPA